MRGLAAYVMSGRAQAVLAVCVLGLVSWLVPFLSLLSVAAVALPTLRKGAREGAFLLALSLAVTTVPGGLVLGNGWQAVLYGVILWVPGWLSAVVLRETGRLAWALGGIAGLGTIVVLIVYLIYQEPGALWEDALRPYLEPVLDDAPAGMDPDKVREALRSFARYLTGAIAAGSVLSFALSLFIARWWQAMLYNPGGFRVEFVNLRTSPMVAYVALGLVTTAVLAADKALAEVALNLLLPVCILFLLTGFAVLHERLAADNRRRLWLIGIYLILVFVPHVLLPIALLGFSDVWMDWRHRSSAG